MKSYKVFLEDTSLEVSSLIVSSQRFNRIWNGIQRSKDQTELAYFVEFDYEKPTLLTVVFDGQPIEKVEIRPIAKNYNYVVKGNKIEITIDRISHFSVEINDYHNALMVFVNPKEKYRPKKNDIYFGAGVHDVGLILPDNNQRVYIDRGAIVYGVIYVEGKTGVSIEGRGVLDASKYLRPSGVERAGDSKELSMEMMDGIRALKNGNEENCEKDLISQIKEGYSSLIVEQACDLGISLSAIGTITARNCRDLKISGIVLIDSFFWTLILRSACENVLIDNVKIVGQWRYNSDGINICDSNNVTVKNCFIRSFDDCIVVRGGHKLTGAGFGCHNINAINNVCWCDWGKVFEIWSGDSNSTISNVKIEENYVIRVSYIVFSIDMRYGDEYTIVNNVKYNNIYVEYDQEHELEQYQSNEEIKYDCNKKEHNEILVFISVGTLGINLGEQRIKVVEKKKPFIVYKNISYNNIFESEPYGKILLKTDQIDEFFNVTFNGKDINI